MQVQEQHHRVLVAAAHEHPAASSWQQVWWHGQLVCRSVTWSSCPAGGRSVASSVRVLVVVVYLVMCGVVVVAVEWHVLVCVCVPVKPTRGNTT